MWLEPSPNTRPTYTKISEPGMVYLKNTYLRGLLNRFYRARNTMFVGYMNFKRQLLLFSHGGITADTMCGFPDRVAVLDDHITKAQKRLTQTGGKSHFELNTISYKSSKIIKVLEAMQTYYGNLLTNILGQCNKVNISLDKEQQKPTKEMLLGMALTASYRPHGAENFINLSPINPGINTILNNKFFCADKKLVQIFGHVPKGFGTGLYKFMQGQQELNIVNLDISQSFKFSGNAENTDNFLIIGSDGTIVVKTVIDLTKLNKQTDKSFKNMSYIYDGPNLTKNTIVIFNNLSDALKNYTPTPELPDVVTLEYVYHGKFVYQNEIYQVHSILNNTNFHKQLVIQKKKSILTTSTHKQKYLKYKMKYLALRKQLHL